jgi:autotransporter strand-loop-strand O-heptosyltransferase
MSQPFKISLDELKRLDRERHGNNDPDRSIIINFIDGPFVEITEPTERNYKIEFINQKNNKVEFETTLKSNHWARCSIQYFVDWLVRINGIDNDLHYEHFYNAQNKRVLISFESKSLGDTLAFIPYVEKFQLKTKCEIICSTFLNSLFKDQYPEIYFVEPGTTAHNIYAMYRIGFFYKEIKSEGIDFFHHPQDPRTISLLQVSSDIFGLRYEEVRPKLPKLGFQKKKQVCIANHSTSQAKFWNHPTGWQEVVDFLRSQNYEVISLSQEEDGYMGNWNPKNITQHPKGDLLNVIQVLQESEFFIGLSSGLSWLAWACNVPTILISGFTDEFVEPRKNVYRIINKNVCNSCWTDQIFGFDDWHWCPHLKGTERQFECTKSIQGSEVIQVIKDHLLPK